MPLKISNLEPSTVTQVNKWADEKEQDITQLQTKVRELERRVAALEKKGS